MGGKQGDAQRVQIFFNTNVPRRSLARISLVVPKLKAGVWAQPKALVFGAVELGGSARRFIDLFDDGKPGREVAEVRSTVPQFFQVRLLPLAPDDLNQYCESAGKLIARAEVTVLTNRFGSFSGDVQIVVANEDRPPDLVPVAGEVVRLVECRPSELVLPRRVGNSWVYSGRVLIFSPTKAAIAAKVQSVPAGIRTNFTSVPDRPDQCFLEIEYQPPGPGKTQSGSSARIRVRVTSSADETELELPVRLVEGLS